MFKILKKSRHSGARLGRLVTNHGVIETPFFVPDATRAVLKGISLTDLKKFDLPALFVNTYHLYLEPGPKLIKKAGGIHQFMSWPGPILSDSGGYQVFSLLHKNKEAGKILPDKVIFRSPINGKEYVLTPEKSIQIQFDLGADIMVALDDCPPHDDERVVLKAVERTISWAKRCQSEFGRQLRKRKIAVKKSPLFLAVVQGGMDKKLRESCARELAKIGFDGLGFGARPVDSQGNFLSDILLTTAKNIPENYLRFNLGLGLPEDILRAVKMGWDGFDCVIPSREGRHGRLYFFGCHPEHIRFAQCKLREGSRGNRMPLKQWDPSPLGKLGVQDDDHILYKVVNIMNSKFMKDFSVINSESKLPELKKYTKAYLHHLFKIQDHLGQRLASLNNLEFYLELMKKIRQEIKEGRL